MEYTFPSPTASRSDTAPNQSTPYAAWAHAAFARAMTIDAFGPRQCRALDWDGFTDRQPGDPKSVVKL